EWIGCCSDLDGHRTRLATSSTSGGRADEVENWGHGAIPAESNCFGSRQSCAPVAISRNGPLAAARTPPSGDNAGARRELNISAPAHLREVWTVSRWRAAGCIRALSSSVPTRHLVSTKSIAITSASSSICSRKRLALNGYSRLLRWR